jgi:hypothetical protein
VSARAVRLIALLALAAGLVVVTAGQSRSLNTLTLVVTFSASSTVSVSLPDGTPVGTTSGTPTQIPAGYYGIDMLGPGGCVQQPLFHLHGPGEDLVNDMNGGDATSEYFQAYLAPNSTYTWGTDNANIGVVHTFVTGPVVEGTPPAKTVVGGSTTTKPTSQDIVGSAIQPMRGTLTGQVSAAGVLSVSFKGKSLTHLAAGRYRINVTDGSSSRGFLVQKAPNAPVAVTGTTFTGKRSRTVTLSAGRWTFEPAAGKPAFTIVVA